MYLLSDCLHANVFEDLGGHKSRGPLESHGSPGRHDPADPQICNLQVDGRDILWRQLEEEEEREKLE